MPKLSAMPESGLVLGELERRVFDVALENWPTTALEVAGHFGDDISTRELKKQASTKYAYYLKKLVRRQLLLSKRVGNALVVWPLQAEKLRAIHKILDFRIEQPLQQGAGSAPNFSTGRAGRKSGGGVNR